MLPASFPNKVLNVEPGGFFESRGAEHKERYRPVRVRTTIMLIAASDAPMTPAPCWLRLTGRPVQKGILGEVFLFQTIPLMVTAARTTVAGSGVPLSETN